ncbi:MAG: hypothetical protein OEU90_03845 [Gammaproteobacteria bacterium]|jgi:hypothetical protein|nr:hypothetical protein [Gammaproteobacteria bacterium]MDH3750578.1 hypothetical protein [Gammaproteobacteria bacterium]MDH3804588.1 hypothetical protein [Gammaproteobacteria bacterium]
MPRKPTNGDSRARQLLAQEAAKIIVEQGIRDYRAAKIKAAERLGLSTRGSLPRNAEIERAVGEHLQLFGRESHADFLRVMREVALSAMEMLSPFAPRLVGPVLSGIADPNSAVNLHVFADSPESVAMRLTDLGYDYKPYERRLKTSRGRGATPDTFAGFRFDHQQTSVEATVFAVDGIRQAPISPINGKPMKRADAKAVSALLEPVDGTFVDGSKAQRSEP